MQVMRYICLRVSTRVSDDAFPWRFTFTVLPLCTLSRVCLYCKRDLFETFDVLGLVHVYLDGR